MSEVNLIINGRPFEMACDDGQEAHLEGLGRDLDQRVTQLAGRVGQVGDLRLVVMAALLIADELQDIKRQGGVPVSSGDGADQAAEVLEGCVQRLESIAAQLEAS